MHVRTSHCSEVSGAISSIELNSTRTFSGYRRGRGTYIHSSTTATSVHCSLTILNSCRPPSHRHAREYLPVCRAIGLPRCHLALLGIAAAGEQILLPTSYLALMGLSVIHGAISTHRTIRYTWSYLISWNYPVYMELSGIMELSVRMELSGIMELSGTHGAIRCHGTIQ
jgi:hypothetical protein